MVQATDETDKPQCDHPSSDAAEAEDRSVDWIISSLGFRNLMDGERGYFLKVLRKSKGDRYAARKKIARVYAIDLPNPW